MKTTVTQIIRSVKAAQTQTIGQRFMLIALIGTADDVPAELVEEMSDALKTSEDHINALQHVIDKMTAG